MAYKCASNYQYGGDCIGLDDKLIGILLNQLQSAWIVHQWVSTVGSTVGSMLGLMVDHLINSTWSCWAIDLSKAFDSSDERLLWLSADRVLRAIIIVTNSLIEDRVHS